MPDASSVCSSNRSAHNTQQQCQCVVFSVFRLRRTTTATIKPLSCFMRLKAKHWTTAISFIAKERSALEKEASATWCSFFQQNWGWEWSQMFGYRGKSLAVARVQWWGGVAHQLGWGVTLVLAWSMSRERDNWRSVEPKPQSAPTTFEPLYNGSEWMRRQRRSPQSFREKEIKIHTVHSKSAFSCRCQNSRISWQNVFNWYLGKLNIQQKIKPLQRRTVQMPRFSFSHWRQFLSLCLRCDCQIEVHAHRKIARELWADNTTICMCISCCLLENPKCHSQLSSKQDSKVTARLGVRIWMLWM